MRYQRVQSSILDGVAYDPVSKTLSVRLKSGREYCYLRVPARLFEGLMHADSAGRFYNNYIKSAGFKSRAILRRQIEEADEAHVGPCLGDDETDRDQQPPRMNTDEKAL